MFIACWVSWTAPLLIGKLALVPVEGMLKESIIAALWGMDGAVDGVMDGVMDGTVDRGMDGTVDWDIGCSGTDSTGCVVGWGLSGSNIAASTPETAGGFSSSLLSTIQRH